MFNIKKEIADINIKIDSLQNLMLKSYNQNKPTEPKKEPEIYPSLHLDIDGSFDSVKLSKLTGKNVIDENGVVWVVWAVDVFEKYIYINNYTEERSRSTYAHFVTYFRWENGSYISLILDRD